jgi:methionine sulfoxide reductase heme-binding subunit
MAAGSSLAVNTAIAAVGPSAYWYLTRSSGAVALVLLTLALVLGVVDVRRWSTETWPRFVVDSLHRNVSLLALAFLALHILTAVLDSFAPISLIDSVIPFTGSYRPFWLGLGALSFDLMLAVILTSLLRRRIGHATWRATHWLSYASWPIALLHDFGTGSDVKSTWMLALSVACLLAVIAAVLVRIAAGWPDQIARRGAALGGSAVFTLGLILWLPGGPLGKEWARRSGTPSALLGHFTSHTSSGSSEASGR